MALIYCRECGRMISDTAPMCPYCGGHQGIPSGMQYPTDYEPENKNSFWIYIISGLIGMLLFVLVFLLVSTFVPECSRSSKKEKTATEQNATADKQSSSESHQQSSEVHHYYDYHYYEYTSKHSEIESWYGTVSSRRLNERDIAGMSNDDLCLLRNLIYAKHGYIFKKSRFRDFFSAYSWYTPRHSNVSHSLNSIENYNVDFIKRHEW